MLLTFEGEGTEDRLILAIHDSRRIIKKNHDDDAMLLLMMLMLMMIMNDYECLCHIESMLMDSYATANILDNYFMRNRTPPSNRIAIWKLKYRHGDK